MSFVENEAREMAGCGPQQPPALAAAYGPDGLRAWKDVDGTRTIFYYDGARLIGQQTGENDPVPIVTGLAGVVAYGETYFLCDPDGNVIQRTDADGALVGTTLYDAWGQQIAGDTPTDPFGYKGQVGYYTDGETGLILCTHRYYDPVLGRWLNRDPIGYDGGENLFAYCGDNPEGGIDPSGYGDPDEIPLSEKDLYPDLFNVIHSGATVLRIGGEIYLNMNPVEGARQAVFGTDMYGERMSLGDHGMAILGAFGGVVLHGACLVGGDLIKLAEKLNAEKQLLKITIGVENAKEIGQRAGYIVGKYGKIQGTVPGLVAHHLIESRFYGLIGNLSESKGLAIMVDTATHQKFTKAWLDAIGRSNMRSRLVRTDTCSAQEVIDAAKKIYADHPEILLMLGLR